MKLIFVRICGTSWSYEKYNFTFCNDSFVPQVIFHCFHLA